MMFHLFTVLILIAVLGVSYFIGDSILKSDGRVHSDPILKILVGMAVIAFFGALYFSIYFIFFV